MILQCSLLKVNSQTTVSQSLVTLIILPALAYAASMPNWPQAAGPNGNWRVSGVTAPIHWSVALDQNIAWRSNMPNGGQSGIAVWGDRIFLTTFAEYKDGE